LLQDLPEERIGIGRIITLQAVVEHVREYELHVIRMDNRLPVEVGVRLCGSLQRQEGAHADDVVLPEGSPRALAQAQKVALQGVRDRKSRGLLLATGELLQIQQDAVILQASGVELQDLQLDFLRRERHRN
jgi:hypothetical protein